MRLSPICNSDMLVYSWGSWKPIGLWGMPHNLQRIALRQIGGDSSMLHGKNFGGQ